ncbi:YeiH family protein [Vagococcus zengguangii]|uniref:Putative sulfate exporter family transporter n=1 Tax=Vagococcus zengguangii TaxID=2571750 RepID=A0A4D7CUT0_9ENTE|nr:putative sulfate exporter family transporter [Vagococcus zengguangii]QCI87153.1 putative sulfate exporter family transporter [Vagococcus zengguangii]TLG80658.1 putative sulfate exporter family transporter [Vagococcus zengguangii]
MKKTNTILPGMVLSLVLSVMAQQLVKLVPTLGSALIAIFLGIIVGNIVGNQAKLDKGTKFSESKLLEVAIALTGLTLSLQSVAKIGLGGITYVVLQMIVTIVGVILIGKWMGYQLDFRLLMGAGNGVCGSSAIATVTPVIGAKEKDKGLAITIVNLTGTLLMIVAPLLSLQWFGNSVMKTSALIGGNLQSVGQVVASAKMVSEPVTEMATIFKLLRVVLLIVVVLVFSKLDTEKTVSSSGEKLATTRKLSVKIPWFIMAFFIGCVLTSTIIDLPATLVTSIKWVSNQFEIMALAAIGLRVNIKHLVKEGPKAMVYGLLVACLQMLTAYALISMLIS